jgi:hypothetical protein
LITDLVQLDIVASVLMRSPNLIGYSY